MKMNKILNILAFPALLTATFACSDEMKYDEDFTQSVTGEHTVTFKVSLQDVTRGTRADNLSHISDGSQIDVLKFAVYEKLDDGSYKIAPEFKKKDEVINKVFTGEGQNLLRVVGSSWKNDPIQIQLVTNPNKSYKVVFWAQNSYFDGYDTADLSHIKVNYSGFNILNPGHDGEIIDEDFGVETNDYLLNNNEKSDVFSAFVDLPKNSQKTAEVTLRRPTAQINVGTAGWDYEGAARLEPRQVIYTQSEIHLEGVAQYYNGLTGQTIVDENHPKVNVTFAFNKIPALYNVYDAVEPISTYKHYKPTDYEEFLRVKSYKNYNEDPLKVETRTEDHPLFAYKPWEYYTAYRDRSDYTKDNYGNDEISFTNLKTEDDRNSTQLLLDQIFPYTEVYKYLSMCYVFVPESSSGVSTGDFQTSGSLLDRVVFRTRGKEITITNTDEGEEVEFKGSSEVTSQEFEITNVPVQKNWRTNILGNDFFTFFSAFHVYVIPDMFDEFDLIWDKVENIWEENIFKVYQCRECGYTYYPWLGEPNPYYPNLKSDALTSNHKILPGTTFDDLRDIPNADAFYCPGVLEEKCSVTGHTDHCHVDVKDDKGNIIGFEYSDKSQFKLLTVAKLYYCKDCGYIYNPINGEPSQNIKPGTPFVNLTSEFHCPGRSGNGCESGKVNSIDSFYPFKFDFDDIEASYYCTDCGYIYKYEEGVPSQGIQTETPFAEIPYINATFACPGSDAEPCGATWSKFMPYVIQ